MNLYECACGKVIAKNPPCKKCAPGPIVPFKNFFLYDLPVIGFVVGLIALVAYLLPYRG